MITTLHTQIITDLETAGRNSPYAADANEPDPRYLGYGVRAKEKAAVFKTHRKAIRQLSEGDQIELAERLIESRYGEQQHIGLFILEPLVHHFTPDRFEQVDQYARCLHGWSKVDSFTGTFLRDILLAYPNELLELVQTWNQDKDMWLQRTSVVLFTRKVAKSGQFNDPALLFCNHLRFSPEDLVRKGVGWSLKDMMRSDKPRIVDVVKRYHAEGVSGTVVRYALKDLPTAERKQILA
ncbi:MAG: DNA alkylation repair protein [Chloroflexota bacterium]